jgi:hypothetical protein
MKAFINYSKVKLMLGVTPEGRQFKCEVRRGNKRRHVVLIADSDYMVESPKDWTFVENPDGTGNIEEVE